MVLLFRSQSPADKVSELMVFEDEQRLKPIDDFSLFHECHQTDAHMTLNKRNSVGFF